MLSRTGGSLPCANPPQKRAAFFAQGVPVNEKSCRSRLRWKSSSSIGRACDRSARGCPAAAEDPQEHRPSHGCAKRVNELPLPRRQPGVAATRSTALRRDRGRTAVRRVLVEELARDIGSELIEDAGGGALGGHRSRRADGDESCRGPSGERIDRGTEGELHILARAQAGGIPQKGGANKWYPSSAPPQNPLLFFLFQPSPGCSWSLCLLAARLLDGGLRRHRSRPEWLREEPLPRLPSAPPIAHPATAFQNAHPLP